MILSDFLVQMYDLFFYIIIFFFFDECIWDHLQCRDFLKWFHCNHAQMFGNQNHANYIGRMCYRTTHTLAQSLQMVTMVKALCYGARMYQDNDWRKADLLNLEKTHALHTWPSERPKKAALLSVRKQKINAGVTVWMHEFSAHNHQNYERWLQ